MRLSTEKVKPSSLFARLRPYDPKGGQPHKKIMLAPLNMTFHAGKFIQLPPAIANKLKAYLEEQYPEDDVTRPCAYQIVGYGEMKRIMNRERQLDAMKAKAAAAGMTLAEYRRLERQNRVESFDFEREERLNNRGATPLEAMAEEIGVNQEEESELQNIADSQKPGGDKSSTKKSAPGTPPKKSEEAKRAAAELAASAAPAAKVEGFDDDEEDQDTGDTVVDDDLSDDDLFAEMQDELSENEVPNKEATGDTSDEDHVYTDEEVQDLLT